MVREIHSASSDNIHISACLKEPAFWGLMLAGLFYFYPLVFLGETLYFRDLFSIFLTQKQLLTDFITSGQFPLWDPYIQGGRPYFANPLNSLFYPTNLLYLVLPFFQTFNFIIVGHFLGYLAAAYILARIIGLRPVSSAVVAIVYGFCGYSLSLINLLNMFLAMLYLPVLLICWHLLLLKAQARWFLLAVFAGALQVCSGSPEVTLLTLMFTLGWSLFSTMYRMSIGRRLVAWGILVLSILGVSAIQILPLLEMLAHSSRRYGLSYQAFSKWSLLPARIPELFLPGFFGIFGKLKWEQWYWGGQLLPERIPLILSLYFGLPILMLALYAGLHRRQYIGFPRRFRRFLLVVLLGSFFLSFGQYLPGFRSLYTTVPLFSLFRFPVKFFSIGLLPVALLAGASIDHHFSTVRTDLSPSNSATSRRFPWIPSSKFMWILWGVTALFGGLGLIFFRPHRFSEWMLSRYFGASTAIMHEGIFRSFLHTTLIVGILTLIYILRRKRPTWWQGWCVAGTLLLDLFVAGQNINSYAPRTLFTEIPDAVPFVRQHLQEGRLYHTQIPPHQVSLTHLPDDMRWMYRWTLETLDNSFAAYFRIPTIFHEDFDRMGQAYVLHLKTLLDTQSWERRLPLLSAAGVSIIIAPDTLTLPEVASIGEIPNWSGIPFYIYRNNAGLQPISFVTNGKMIQNNADALGSLLHPDYDPRYIVLLQEPESTLSLLFTQKRLTDGLASLYINFEQAQKSSQLFLPSETSSTCEKEIQVLKNTVTAVSLRVSTTCDGYLVFTTPYYPGWHVTIDQQVSKILRANYAFSAVHVPAGTHEIRRWYRPMSLIVGSTLSFLSCGLIGIGLRKKHWQRTLFMR